MLMKYYTTHIACLLIVPLHTRKKYKMGTIFGLTYEEIHQPIHESWRQDRREGGGGRGGKRSRALAPKGPVHFMCHRIFFIAIYLCSAFLWQFICFERVFARTVDFDDSFHVRDQTVVLIFLIY